VAGFLKPIFKKIICMPVTAVKKRGEKKQEAKDISASYNKYKTFGVSNIQAWLLAAAINGIITRVNGVKKDNALPLGNFLRNNQTKSLQSS